MNTDWGFTDDEIDTLTVIYGPTRIGGTEIYPRTVIGGEFPGLAYADGNYTPAALQSAWEGRSVPDTSGVLEQKLIVKSWFRYLAFETDDAERDWRKLEPERDYPRSSAIRTYFQCNGSRPQSLQPARRKNDHLPRLG